MTVVKILFILSTKKSTNGYAKTTEASYSYLLSSKILQKRLTPYDEHLIGQNQGDFRAYRSLIIYNETDLKEMLEV